MNTIHKRAKAMNRMLYVSALSMIIMVLCTVDCFAQDKWILEISEPDCAYKSFSGLVDGVFTTAAADYYPWVRIESTTGVVSGTANSATYEDYDCSYCAILDDQIICDANQQNCYQPCLVWQEQTCQNVLCSANRSVSLAGQTCLENTLNGITVRLYKEIQPPSTNHGCGGVNLSTTSPASSYIWEVSDDPNNSSSWKVIKTTATSSTSIQSSELSSLGLNLSGLLYSRVKDPSCQWRISSQSNSFRIFYPAPTFTLTPQGPDCFGGNDGKITVSVPSGSLSHYSVTLFYENDTDPVYQLENIPANNFPFVIDESRHNLTSANWKVYVQNAVDQNNKGDCGTTVATNVPVTQRVAGSKTSDTPVQCLGENNGSVTLSVANGTAGFTYELDGNAASPAAGSTVRAPKFTGLSGGSHTIKIKDVNSCESELISIPVVAPTSMLVPSISINKNISCFEKNDGILIASPSGGASGYSYRWSNNSPHQSISNLGTGPYTVEITDAYGCMKSISESLVRPSRLNFDLNVARNISCMGVDDAMLEVTNIVNKTGTVTYHWSNGETADFIDAIGAGTYTVSISDGAGCTSLQQSKTLVDPAGYSVSISPLSDFHGNRISCNGENDGKLGTVVRNLADTDGDNITTANHYTWLKNGQPFDNGAALNSVDDLEEATYKVIISYGGGCSAEETYSLSDPNPVSPVVSITSTALHHGLHLSCPGASNGSLHAAGSGGAESSPYTFLWDSGTTGPDLTGKPAGTYTVTARDINGCTGSTSKTLLDPPPINPSVSIATTYNGLHLSCYNETDGKLHATTTGGGGSVSFMWNTGQTGPDLDNIGAGSYFVTATDENGCSEVSPAKVLVNPSPVTASIIITSDFHGQALSCFNEDDGSLSVTASGGTNSFTYLWSTGTPGSTLSGLEAGTYSVTAKDINGCEATDSETIINPEPVVASITDISDFNGYGVRCQTFHDGYLQASATGGTGTFTYLWPVLSETNATASDLGAGNYTVIATDENGCSDDVSGTITEPALLEVSLAGKTNILCFDAATGEIILTPAGGAGIYEYSINTIDWQAGNIFAGLKAASHTIQLRDGNGCTDQLTEMLTQPEKIMIDFTTAPAFCADPRGEAVASVTGGVGSYDYEWKDINDLILSHTNSITNRAAGVYSLKITDDNACPMEATIGISTTDGPQSEVREVIDARCSYSSDGSSLLEVVQGDGPFEILWPNGQTTLRGSGLAKGTYFVTITDVNNCSSTKEVSVGAPDLLRLQLSEATQPSCNGFCDGKIKVEASGGTGNYSFTWTGQLGALASNLCAGNHSVHVSDENNCEAGETFLLEQPDPLQINLVSRQLPSCYNGCNGSIGISSTGGNGTNTYGWSSGSNTVIASDICAGDHVVTVTDIKNCTLQRTYNLGQPEQLQLRLSKKQIPICHNGCDGELEVAAFGGTGSYRYNWNSGAATAAITDLCSNNYNVSVTDDNNCTTDQTYSIENPAALTMDLGGSITLCVGQTHVLNATGQWISYKWDSNTGLSAATPQVTISEAGQYWVEVFNSDGCIAQDTFLLETSRDLLEASFLIPGEALVGDTIVIVDISWPMPESTTWSFPTAMDKLLDLGEVIYGRFNDPGIYEVRLETQLGQCADLIGKTIAVLNGENENEEGRLGHEEYVKNFSLHPNPTEGNFEISVEFAEEGSAGISIWNTPTGYLLKQVQGSGKKNYKWEIDLRPVSSGTYVVRLDYTKGKKYIRFIVK